MMAPAVGHLIGKFEIGMFGMILALASVVLVFCALLHLIKSGSRRSAILLSFTLALTLLAGQGYVQLGLLVIFPAVIFIFPRQPERLRLILRQLAFAVGVSLLQAAPLIVPALHFLPNIGKEIDTELKFSQPLGYIPLNLVIREPTFFRNDSLSKYPYPSFYINYIGWLAVILAVYHWLKLGKSVYQRGGAFLFHSILVSILVL